MPATAAAHPKPPTGWRGSPSVRRALQCIESERFFQRGRAWSDEPPCCSGGGRLGRVMGAAKALSVVRIEPRAAVFDLDDVVGEHAMTRLSFPAALAIDHRLASPPSACDHRFAPSLVFGGLIIRSSHFWWGCQPTRLGHSQPGFRHRDHAWTSMIERRHAAAAPLKRGFKRAGPRGIITRLERSVRQTGPKREHPYT